jgi:cytochrome c oxidase subunit 2
MSAPNWTRLVAIAACALVLGGCEGVQSTLAPQGPEAARVARLFWALTIGSAVILAGVVVLAAVALTGRAPARRRLDNEAIVIAGGIVFPIVTLTAVLVWSEIVMGANATRGDGNVVRIGVVGERWWWRVTYRDDEGRRIESANELRIPVGRPVEIELTSADVIHSFWVPKLAGKLDMIPGRRNVLRLQADAPGAMRGQCAEYCGGPHALMALYVLAEPPEAFDRWAAEQRQAAASPASELQQRGRALLLANCATCHTVRGTPAAGRRGPDLTHVGSRRSIGAGLLPANAGTFAAWISSSQHLKPGNLMPSFESFGAEDLRALAAYLESLR